MNVSTLTDAPLIQIFTILIEDLYAPVFSIVDENSVRGWIDRTMAKSGEKVRWVPKSKALPPSGKSKPGKGKKAG